MNSISFGREKILKELVQDVIKNTYDGLNDDDIKKNIISYLTLKERFEDKQYELTEDEYIELNSLNQFFYGSNFGESKNISTSIVDLFKASYNEVKDILEKNNTTGPELISLLSGILNIKYNNKKNKDELIIKYLNEIIIPALTGNKLKITNSITTDIVKSTPSINVDFSDSPIPDEVRNKTRQKSNASNIDYNDDGKKKRITQLQARDDKNKEDKRAFEAEKRDNNSGKQQDQGKIKEETKGKSSRSDNDKKQQKEIKKEREKEELEKKEIERKKRIEESKKFDAKNMDEIDENDKSKLNLDYDKTKLEKALNINIENIDDVSKQLMNFSINDFENFIINYETYKTYHYDYIIKHLYNLITYNLYNTDSDIDKYSVYEEILSILLLFNSELNYYFLYNFDFFIESIKEHLNKVKNPSETETNKKNFIKIINNNLDIIINILKYRLDKDEYNIEFDVNIKKIYEITFKKNYLNVVKFYHYFFTERNMLIYNDNFIKYLKEILNKFNELLSLKIFEKVSKDNYKLLSEYVITKPAKIFEIQEVFKSKTSGGVNLDYCFISFIEIYKLYYNCISFKNGNLIFKNIFDNKENYIIYFFYLFFNAYSYYFKDKIEHEFIDELKEIIKHNYYSEEILLKINDLIIKIFNNIYNLFDEYIKEFNDTDSIIQNYYTDKKQKLYYLFINFIYPFYININKKDLNFTLSINQTLIKINKKYDEIKSEINELLYNQEFINYIYNYLVKKLTVKILNTNDYLKSEIEYLIKFIYYYTSSKNKIILTSLYEVNAYIILKLLTSSESITLNINGINYNFPSSLTKIIKNHPYIFELQDNDDNDLKVEIKISEKQEELYKCILHEKNYKQILLILTEDFSYLNLDLKKNIKFKFYLNKEIITFVDDKSNDYTNSLINYGAYNFSLKSTLNPNLHIFNVIIDKKYYKLLFSINYATFLCSSLYKKINLYNYSTLIYLYIYIKYQIEHETKEYLKIINYNGSNDILNKYKNLLKTNNLLNFFKIVIILMQIKLSNKYDLNTFIYYLLNFSQNKYVNKLKSKIYIDINFITELFKNKNQTTDINFYTFLLNLSTILYENCILNNFNENKEVIELMYNFFIPILKELCKYKEHITITKLEKYVIDIRALELSNMICKKKLIGGDNTDNSSSSIGEIKEEINMDKIVNKLSFLNKFKKDYEKFDIQKLKEKLKEKFDDYLKIPKYETKDNKTAYISQDNYSDILPPIDNPFFLNKIADLVSAIKINKSKIIKELKNYNIFIERNNERNDNLNDDIYGTKKIEEELKTFIEYLTLLEKYKSNKVVSKIISHFYKTNKKKDDDDGENDENNKIIKDIESYISLHKNIIDTYIEILQENLEKYDILSESIKKAEQAYRDDKLKYKAAERVPGGYYNNIILKGGDFQNPKINKLIEKDENDVIKRKESTKNKIDDIIKDVKKLKSNNVILNSIDKQVAASNFIDDNGDNLFEKMLNSYNEDIKTTIPEIAENKFYNDVLENDLDPEIELALTFNDKIIFIVVIFLLRLASLYITYYFIDNNVIFGIVNALYYYTIAYLIVFIIVLITINIDAFKLRILLNYFNMHVNSSNIYTHVILKLIIGYIVYLLIINLNIDPDPTRLSKNQKIKLKYKLDILTMIVLIFIVTFTLII
jgi:hypothetical protein